MHCDVISSVICVLNKVGISRRRLREILPKKLYCHPKRPLQYNQQLVGQNFMYVIGSLRLV